MEEVKKQDFLLQKSKAQETENQESKQTWHCDIYCRKIRHVTCEGREHANSNAPDLCPYFDEMLY